MPADSAFKRRTLHRPQADKHPHAERLIKAVHAYIARNNYGAARMRDAADRIDQRAPASLCLLADLARSALRFGPLHPARPQVLGMLEQAARIASEDEAALAPRRKQGGPTPLFEKDGA